MLGKPVAREGDDEDGVRRRGAHAHDGAGQGRHGQGRARQEQRPGDSTERRRQSHDDDERVEPRLEVDHDDEVDQHDGQRETGQELHVGRAHGRKLPAKHDGRTPWRAGGHASDDLVYGAADRPKIASLHAGVDVDHRLNCIMRNDARRSGLRHSGQCADDLRRRVRRVAVALVHRNGLQVVDGRQLLQGRLHIHEMRDARGRIEPVGRGDLSASREDRQRVVRNVRFRQPGRAGEIAVRCQHQGRLPLDLLNVDIGGAGDLPNPGGHLRRVSVGLGLIYAGNADVYR